MPDNKSNSSRIQASLAQDEELARRMQYEEDLQSSHIIMATHLQSHLRPRSNARSSQRAASRRPYGMRYRENTDYIFNDVTHISRLIATSRSHIRAWEDHLIGNEPVNQDVSELMRRDLTANDYERLLQLEPVKNNGAAPEEIASLPVYYFKASPVVEEVRSQKLCDKSSSSGSGRDHSIQEVIVLDASPGPGSNTEEKVNVSKRTSSELDVAARKRQRSTCYRDCNSRDRKRVVTILDSADRREGIGSSSFEDSSVIVLDDSPSCAKSHKEGQVSDLQEKCCICIETFVQGEELMRLPCFHSFHSSCARKWLAVKATCPICNERIVAQLFY